MAAWLISFWEGFSERSQQKFNAIFELANLQAKAMLYIYFPFVIVSSIATSLSILLSFVYHMDFFFIHPPVSLKQ